MKISFHKLLFSISKKFLFQYKGLLALTLVYLISFILMLPLRNVSFEDDFAYIQTTQHLLNTGEFRMSEWSSAAMIPQAYWGAIFAKIFGFSIMILHLSNLVLLYFASIAFYCLLRRLKLEQSRALFFTLFLLAFPWVFQFAFSVMTDVFYMSFLIISLYFYTKAFQDRRSHDYILGSIFAGLAFLNRQIGIVIPTSFLIITIYRFLIFKKIYPREILLPLIPLTIIIVPYMLWLNKVGPTVFYTRAILDPLKNEYLPYILPFQLNRIGITNSHYIEALIVRGLAYFYNTITFLLPIFLIYRINNTRIFKILRQNIMIICLIASIFTMAYFIDGLYSHKLTKFPPDLILRYDKIFLDWDTWWSRLVFISLPIWIVIIAGTTRNLLHTLSTRREKPHIKIFLKLEGFYLLSIFILLRFLIFPSSFSASLHDSWFFLIIVFLLITFLSYVFTFRKLQKIDTNTTIFIFFGLITATTLFILMFLNSYYYQEYIIQFIPIFIIWIAYFFKGVRIDTFRAIVITILMLLFSVQITRYRYQFEGAKWDLATKLVTEGINPYNVSPNWPWRPYWFFESSFAEVVKEFGGNKYNVPEGRIGNWFAGTPPGDTYYYILTSTDPIISQIEIYNQKPAGKKEVVLESEHFWLFTGFKKVVAVKKPNPS